MSLINREDLIAEHDRVHVGEPGGARKLMEDAPTIEERKWIPVTERLPEKKDKYIVTVNRDGYPYTSEDDWTGEKWWAYLNKHITAWMPMPEPYTEETNA